MSKQKEYMQVNLQLFASGDTIPTEDPKVDSIETNPEEAKEFARTIRSTFGLKDKEPAKKEPESEINTNKNPEENQTDKPQEEIDKPEDKVTEKVDEEKEPEFDEILYNKEKVKIPVTERQAYLQKGYNYDKVKTEAESAKATLKRIAQTEGFNTVDEYLAEIGNREKAKLAEQIEEAAGDPDKINEIVENHPIVKQTKEERKKLDYENAKNELKKDSFFKELEPQFEALMEQNPNSPPDLVYKIIRNDYLTPEKLKELISKEKASAEKKIIADVHDKERRTTPTGGDAGGAKDTAVPTDFSKKLAGVFGVSASKIAQRAHEKMKRS